MKLHLKSLLCSHLNFPLYSHEIIYWSVNSWATLSDEMEKIIQLIYEFHHEITFYWREMKWWKRKQVQTLEENKLISMEAGVCRYHLKDEIFRLDLSRGTNQMRDEDQTIYKNEMKLNANFISFFWPFQFHHVRKFPF